MKFGQLTEYNKINIFLEESYTKCCRETIPRRFSEKSKLSKSPDQQPTVLYSLYLLYAKLTQPKDIETITLNIHFYLKTAFLKKQKQIWNQSCCLIFCMIFEEKYSIKCLVAFTSRDIGQYVYCNCFATRFQQWETGLPHKIQKNKIFKNLNLELCPRFKSLPSSILFSLL